MALKPMHYDLDAWKEAMRLARSLYECTASMPESERFGLTLQMRRSAVSVPSNIAEGVARGSAAEFRRFLLISRGSLMELDTQIWIAKDLGYLPADADLSQRLERVFRLLNGLIRPKAKTKTPN